MGTMRSLAIFGGTFDPVHFGHLRMALELLQSTAIDELCLLPCGEPPHRPPTLFNAAQRLAMLQLAVNDEPSLRIDRREIDRPGLSYMVDTLADIREEVGDDVSLVLVLGTDAFVSFDSWHQWERIPELAHILVVTRPGVELPLDSTMTHFLHAREMPIETLNESACGRVFRAEQTLLDISSSHIRDLLRQGHSPRYLLPDSVCSFINDLLARDQEFACKLKS